jgi:hypothetical protein
MDTAGTAVLLLTPVHVPADTGFPADGQLAFTLAS